jgi:glycosyltransferase involved in cell wall biosynthesis
MIISVVIPCYQAEETIQELHLRLELALTNLNLEYEIIFVDDGSTDLTWESIVKISKETPFVQGIKLSRNFGQHNAVTAGLEASIGEWVVVMDCDLQDRPEEIIHFYQKAQEGFDVVVGLRSQRKDNWIIRKSSLLFHWTFKKIIDSKFDSRIGNFGIYSKKVVVSILKLKEQHRSFGLLVLWVGFSRAEISIQHESRKRGNSNYSLIQRLSLAFESIISHSNKILYLAINLGLFIAIISFCLSIYLISRYFIFGITTQGWTSLIVSMYLTSGILLLAVGFLGIYVGKIFNESKERPLFLIDSRTNSD